MAPPIGDRQFNREMAIGIDADQNAM